MLLWYQIRYGKEILCLTNWPISGRYDQQRRDDSTMMNLRRLLMISSLVLLLSGCAWFRPFHSTALDALTESPGELFNPDFYIPDSVIVLQQQAIAGGQVLLYRWQSSASQEAGTYCLAATFVTPEGNGWRAQSTGLVTNEYPRPPRFLGARLQPMLLRPPTLSAVTLRR